MLKKRGLILLLLLVWVTQSAFADFLSIKYSKKNQIRTGMIWVKFKPELVLNENWRKKRTETDFGAELVSEDLMRGTLPYSAVGKLFFTTGSDKVSSCSAAFVGGGSVVITAAHCVMTSTGDWNEDFIFIRSYGSAEQEVYAIQCVAVPAKWGEVFGDAVLVHDYAFLRTNRRSSVGSLGITNGAPPDQVKIVGYSDNFADGRRMLRLPTYVIRSQEGKIGTRDNPFETGNSGAPWLDVSTVYSVSSHYKKDDAGIMWGPRLRGQTTGIVNYVVNGCN